jgi:hypothetical protein
MKTKTTLLLLVSLLSFIKLSSQTIVKMDMPPQADQALNVVALFDEEIPEDIPVVLGLMGYDVEGGIAPYFFEWMLNGEVISTSDIAIFTPQKGDDLVLKVTDNNKCRASTAFNLKVGSFAPNPDPGEKKIKIYPTVFNSEINIRFQEEVNKKALIRIFDLKGLMVYQKYLQGDSSLQLNLNPGIYFISVKSGEVHTVEKIIAQ